MRNKGVKSDLFELVRTMTMNEKRYFKIYASQHSIGEGNKYIKLFDAFAEHTRQSKVYDESSIKSFFKGDALVKQFAVAKNYLYEIILKALASYHTELSTNIIIRRYLNSVEILYHRGLYKQSKAILNKAEKLARKRESFTELASIYQWKFKIISALSYQKLKEKDIDELNKEEQEIIKHLDTICQYNRKRLHVVLKLRKQGFIRSQKELQQIDKAIILHPLLQNESLAKSLTAKEIYHHTLAFYHYTLANYAVSYKHLQSALAIYEKLSMEKEDKDAYASILNNIATAALLLKKYDEASLYLKKTELIPADSLRLRVKIFTNTSIAKLELYNATAQTEKGLLFIPILENGIKLYQNQIGQEESLFIYYNLAILLFTAGELKESHYYLHKILNNSDARETKDLYGFALILNLLILFEMKQYDILVHQHKGTRHFLYKRKLLFKFESALLQYLRKIAALRQTKSNVPMAVGSDSKPITNLFKELYEQLLVISEDKYESRALEYFDFISWVESKMKEKPFANVVKEKSMRRNSEFI